MILIAGSHVATRVMGGSSTTGELNSAGAAGASSSLQLGNGSGGGGAAAAGVAAPETPTTATNATASARNVTRWTRLNDRCAGLRMTSLLVSVAGHAHGTTPARLFIHLGRTTDRFL